MPEPAPSPSVTSSSHEVALDVVRSDVVTGRPRSGPVEADKQAVREESRDPASPPLLKCQGHRLEASKRFDGVDDALCPGA